MSLTTQILSDGVKNCSAKVTGWDITSAGWVIVVRKDRFSRQPRMLKIDHIEWAVTAGIEVFVAWHAAEGERELIAPLAGRGKLDFADYGGLSNLSEGKSGDIEVMVQAVGMKSSAVQAFTLFLDMQKQGG